jgi:hypothetical protein
MIQNFDFFAGCFAREPWFCNKQTPQVGTRALL